MQDWLLDLLARNPACYHCAVAAKRELMSFCNRLLYDFYLLQNPLHYTIKGKIAYRYLCFKEILLNLPYSNISLGCLPQSWYVSLCMRLCYYKLVLLLQDRLWPLRYWCHLLLLQGRLWPLRNWCHLLLLWSRLWPLGNWCRLLLLRGRLWPSGTGAVS